MEKEHLINLTNELYRLTLLFPKKEPLRYKIRGLALEILENQKEKNLEAMDSFFEVAKRQNWVSQDIIIEIQREYSKIRTALKNRLDSNDSRGEIKGFSFELPQKQLTNNRQQKIMNILKDKGKAQVGELKPVFPEVTKRTLRRDFEQLLRQGMIRRIGERNGTFYQLN